MPSVNWRKEKLKWPHYFYWHSRFRRKSYYVNSTQNTTDPCPNGKTCTVTLTVPSGAINGDVLAANVTIGENASQLVTMPNSNWDLSYFSNVDGGFGQQVSGSTACGSDKPFENSGWLAFHIVQSGDPSQISFSVPSKDYTACAGTVTPGMFGSIVDYRDAGHLQLPIGGGSGAAYGYGSTANSNQLSFGPFNSPQADGGALPAGTMLVEPILFSTGEGAITGVTGSPTLNQESSSLAVFDPIFNTYPMSFGGPRTDDAGLIC